MKRKTLALAAVVAAPLLMAYAYGGWATITVENLPEYLVAGQPTNVTFSIRQHGDNLLKGLTPRIEAKMGDRELVARAVETNKPGFYTATVNVPEKGAWDLTIRSSFGPSDLSLLPIPAVTAGTRPVAMNEEVLGHHLFVAKGCMTCHEYAKVKGSGRIKVGPELTGKQYPKEYLAQFLANPGIKGPGPKGERMPNLGLKSTEIAALTAFINGSKVAGL